MVRRASVAAVGLLAVVSALSVTIPAVAQAPSGPPSSPPPRGAGPSTTVTSGPGGPSGPAGGPGRPADDPEEVQQAARQGLIVIAEEAAVLDELGAFPEPLPDELQAIVDEAYEGDTWYVDADREDLIDELVILEDEATGVLEVLLGARLPVDGSVRDVLGGLTDEQWAALEGGATGGLDATLFVVAADAMTRNGRPGLDPNTPPVDAEVLAISVRAAYSAEVGSAEDDSATTASSTSTTAAPTTVPVPTTATSSSQDTPGWVWLVVALGALAVVAAAILLGRRRRADGDDERFDDLLEVSRRLAGARDAAEVERTVGADAKRLLDATAVGIVHRQGAELAVGHETDGGFLVPDHLADGLLRRVVDTGQPVYAVVRDEPAVRHLPVSLVAVPIIAEGRVKAVVAAVRPPERPFAANEVNLLHSLGPVLAAALDTARRVEDAASASLTDPLTGVGNRRSLEEDLPGALASATGPTSLVMVDLDHFKAVNDRYGHPGGDAVLRQAAAALVATVRPGDRVYRYGGEEFAVLLPATGEAEAVAAAERLRVAVASSPFDVGDGQVHGVTASMGVSSTAGDDDEDGLALVARADRALYRAKEGGRDRVVAASALAS